MPKMDVPKPVYDWLLQRKTALTIVRGRTVTWPEVFEDVQAESEAAAAALLAAVKVSGQ